MKADIKNRPLCIKERGFTLMEVLIGMALLSLLMLALGATMQSAAQAQERIDARLRSAEDLRLSAYFLQDVLSQASLRAIGRDGLERPRFFFDGQAQSLEWAGAMPARYGLGGRHFMRLALEPGEGPASGQGTLTLRYLPWQESIRALDWAAAPRQTLAAPVRALTLRYQRAEDGQWLDQWPPSGDTPTHARLPAAIALSVDGPQPAWPLLAVAMHAPIVSDQAALSAGFGGGRRR